MKANRFLNKDSIKKEKLKIANDIKSNFIAMGKNSNNLPQEKGMYVKKGELKQETDSDDDDFVDIEDESSEEEEMKKPPPKNKRHAKEDPRNTMYLKSFRERVE